MKNILILLSFILPLNAVLGQQTFGSRTSENTGSGKFGNLSTNKIAIVNNTSSKLYYQLSFPYGDWSNQDISPNTVNSYNMQNQDFINIKVTTGSKSVEYKLTGGKRYEIEWNYSSSRWDVYSVSME